MTRADLVEKVIAAKLAKGLTLRALAESCGRSEVWTTSALLGQQAMGAEEAAAVGRVLELDTKEQGDRVKVTMRGKFLPYRKW